MGIRRMITATIAAAALCVGVGAPVTHAEVPGENLELNDYYWQCQPNEYVKNQTDCTGHWNLELGPTGSCFYSETHGVFLETREYAYRIRWVSYRGNVKVTDDGTLRASNRKAISDHSILPSGGIYVAPVPSCP
jgi:hypothetical protein